MASMNATERTLDAEVLAIGFGKGGKTAAAQLGRLGKRVVLVEQSDRMYGGTCPNVGCVPSKGLVHHSGKRRATVVDPHTVRVQADGERLTITAETILINTGSEPNMPNIPGLSDSPYTL